MKCFSTVQCSLRVLISEIRRSGVMKLPHLCAIVTKSEKNILGDVHPFTLYFHGVVCALLSRTADET